MDKNIDNENNKVEAIVARCLQIGVGISAAIIFIGLFMFLLTGQSGYPGSAFPTNLTDVFRGVIMLKPYAIILLGLLILILTPVFRVAVSIIAFWKEKDFLYVGITSIVLIILIIGFMLGKVE